MKLNFQNVLLIFLLVSLLPMPPIAARANRDFKIYDAYNNEIVWILDGNYVLVTGIRLPLCRIEWNTSHYPYPVIHHEGTTYCSYLDPL